MRKNFIILVFALFSVLPKFSYANPDVINQQRNIEFMNMMGQIEYDKRRERERAEAAAAAAAQRQAQLNNPYMQPDEDILWSVFVWNDETGNAHYVPCGRAPIGWFAKRKVIKNAQKTYTEIYTEKPNRYIDWDCSFAAITMGVSKKTGKIEAYVDTDIKGWVEKYGENNPDFVKLVNQGALDYCSTQADNCELIYGIHELPEDKK